MSPILSRTSPGTSPASPAALPGDTACTTIWPSGVAPEVMPRNGSEELRRVTAMPAFGSTESYGSGSRPLI